MVSRNVMTLAWIVGALALPAAAHGGTVSVTPSGVVEYVADPGEQNHVKLWSWAPGVIRVEDAFDGVVAGDGCTASSGGALCSSASEGWVVHLGDENDLAEVFLHNDGTVFGDAGDDRMRLVRGVADGGDGVDTAERPGGTNTFDLGAASVFEHGLRVISFSAVERVRGGEGSDTFLGTPGSDVFFGYDTGPRWDEVNTVSYENRAERIVVLLNDARGGAIGTAENDQIIGITRAIGGSSDDVMGSASDGPSELIGGAGGDVLLGGSYDDILRAQDGDDRVRPGAGDDLVVGGFGDDTVDYVHDGPMVIDLAARFAGAEGSRERDQLVGIEHATGGGGPDTIVGDDNTNTLDGGGGDDMIDSRDARADHVICGDGDDRLAADTLDSVEADCERVTRYAPSAGVDGVAGPPGPAGPSGSPGAATTVQRLFVALAHGSFRGRSGRPLRIPFVASSSSSVVIEIHRGDRRVKRWIRRALRGRNAVRWRGTVDGRPARPGRYSVTLRATGADGQQTADRATVVLTRRR